MKLITLAKMLDFQTENEYFDYCIENHINGNFKQCKILFKDMTKEDQKRLIRYISNCYEDVIYKPIYDFYFNLL